MTVYPRYPEYAAANYIKGLVEVKFDIGADGTVTRIVFLRSEPHNLFRDEVVKAMAKWRFEKNRPCLLYTSGKPLRSYWGNFLYTSSSD